MNIAVRLEQRVQIFLYISRVDLACYLEKSFISKHGEINNKQQTWLLTAYLSLFFQS